MGRNLTMPEYDPEALDTSAEESEVNSNLNATITDITQDVAHNIFGDDVESDPDKEMLIVTAMADMGDETQEFESVFSLPESEKSWLNPLFKLARFRSKYGQVPREDMEIEVATNDKGFLDIDIPSRVDIGEQN